MNRFELSLDHKDWINSLLKCEQGPASEYSFANLFLFRKKHRFHIVSVEGYHYIEGVSYSGEKYGMPLFSLTSLSLDLFKKILENVNYFFPVNHEIVNHYPFYCSCFDDGESDYVYSREKLAHLPGRKLHKKRNLIKNFINNNDYSVKSIEKSDIDSLIDILDIWQSENILEHHETDYEAAKEAIVNMEVLGLQGLLCRVNGNPVGFTIGEKRENDFLLHFAKGLKSYKGLYPLLFQEQAKKLPEDIKWINLEQDLNQPNLRKTKHSFQPDCIVKKYRLKLCPLMK